MPMLIYSPEKRATAQDLLDHYWLKMPPNFDFTMSEKEYQRMMMIKQSNNKKNSEKPEEPNKQDIFESDDELNNADDEDNEEYKTADEFDQFSGDDEDHEQQFDIPNYNNSFAAYGQYVSLSSLDRANPQFQELSK